MLPDGFVDRADQGYEGRSSAQLIEEMIQEAKQDRCESIRHVPGSDIFSQMYAAGFYNVLNMHEWPPFSGTAVYYDTVRCTNICKCGEEYAGNIDFWIDSQIDLSNGFS